MFKYFLFLNFIFVPLLSFSQKWDIGLHTGGAGYMGEINQTNPLQINRPEFGFTVRKNLDPSFSIRIGLDQAWIHGDDSKSKNPDQIERNLNFSSAISEASFVFEFNFFKFNPFVKDMSYSPYLFAGISGFIHNPYTFLNGQKVFLRPIGTEGEYVQPPQRKPYYTAPYSTLSWSLPVGVGFKYHLKENLSLNVEYGYRFSFTDYLDDIGGVYPDLNGISTNSQLYQLSDRSVGKTFLPGDQRGDSRKYDKFFFAGIGLTYTFRSLECPKFSH